MKKNIFFLCSIVIIGSYQLSQIVFGVRPVSQDHTAHFFRTNQLYQQILENFSLFFWSDAFFAGYPAGLDYPIGANLSIILLKFVSFNILSLSQAYAVVYSFSYLLVPLAVYWLARKDYSPIVALLTAILLLYDKGVHPQGGWNMVMLMGVWPVYLSLGVFLSSICFLKSSFSGASSRDLGFSAFLLGFALLVHPFQLINIVLFAISLVIFLVVYSSDFLNLKRFFLVGLVLVLGLAISSLWLLPFLSVRDYNVAHGSSWLQLYQVVEGIVQGNLFSNAMPFLTQLGFFGLLINLFSTSKPKKFFSVYSFFVLLFATQDFQHFFGLGIFSEFTARVETGRLLLLVKPFWYLAGIDALVCLFRGLSAGFNLRIERVSRHSRFIAGSFVLLLLYPLLAPVAKTVYSRFYSLSAPSLENSTAFLEGLDEIAAKINRVSEKDPRFFRVGLVSKPNSWSEHMLLDLGSKLKAPMHKMGFLPSFHFLFSSYDGNSDDLRILNVRFVVSYKEEDRTDLELLSKFGNLYLYEFLNWDWQRAKVVNGSGFLEVVKFDPESEILIDVEKHVSGELRLSVAYFPGWKATLDGKEIELYPSLIEGYSDIAFLTTKLESGKYRFYFERNKTESLGLILFVVGVIGCLFLCFCPSKILSEEPTLKKEQSYLRLLFFLFTILVLFVVFLKKAQNKGPWKITYYKNPNFTGQLVEERARSINRTWYYFSPVSNAPKDNFSVKFESCLKLEKRTLFHFGLKADDWAELRIGDEMVVSQNWKLGFDRREFAVIDLLPGYYPIEVRYREDSKDTLLFLDARLINREDVSSFEDLLVEDCL